MRSARLKNIEETEKAKRAVAEVQKGKRAANNDEEHLSATRCEQLLHVASFATSIFDAHNSLQAKPETEIGC